jgi:hypothetical protein
VTQSTLPIFLNGSPLRVPSGSSLGTVLAEHDPDLLAAMLGHGAQATDARGLPVDPDAPVHAGAIYRVFRSARRDEAFDA